MRVLGSSLALLRRIRSSRTIKQRARGSPSTFDVCPLQPQILAKKLSPKYAILGLEGRIISAFRLL